MVAMIVTYEDAMKTVNNEVTGSNLHVENECAPNI